MNRIAEVTMYSTMYGFVGSLFYITVTNYTWKKIKERLNNEWKNFGNRTKSYL